MRNIFISVLMWIANFMISIMVVSGLIMHEPIISVVCLVGSFALYSIVALATDKSIDFDDWDDE